jgi:DNA primase
MAGRIPQNFIDELIARTDIVDVIDARVPLKKKGRDYMACCPFHNEKTPSFSVSQEKQFYYCFGCGASGTALGFLMDYEHMDFVTAIEELAARANMTIPREEGAVTNTPDYQPLYNAMQTTATFFKQQLRQHPQAKRAVDYLKNRGLTGEIAEAYDMGYAPPGWDNLIRAMGSEGVNIDHLIQTGMVVDRDNKRYDRFRDRIMFPIHDHRGRVVAFGGRVLDANAKPKYLNSPETPIFHKGQTLYGLYQARQHLRQIDKLLVVEGYMDVVALAQFGVRYAVATLGTATTHEHLERLFRTTDEIVFCFDGDRAGRQAAQRAIDNLLPMMHEGRQARFLFLPEGDDPDTLVRREGVEAFSARIASAIPFSTFFFDNLRSGVDTSYEEGRARLVKSAKPLLAKMPDGVFKDMMVEKLANIASYDLERIQQQLSRSAEQDEPSPAKKTVNKQQVGRGKKSPSLIRRAITCLLQRPDLAQSVADSASYRGLELPGADLLIEVLDLLKLNPHLNAAALIEHWRDKPEGVHLQKLVNQEDLIAPNLLDAEFSDCMQQLAHLREKQTSTSREVFLANKPFAELSDEEKSELKEIHSQKAAKKKNIRDS